MAIIYSYPYVSTVNNSDTLVISVSDTTADNGFLTKSLTADNLASYVTARVNLTFSGNTGIGAVNLDTQELTISGTSNEIETSASSQTLQIGLPDNVTITNNLTVNGNTALQGTLNVTGQSTLSSVNVTDLTSGRVVLVGTSGELQDDSDLTFTGSTLTATNLTVSSLTETNSLQVNNNANVGGNLDVTNTLTVQDNQGSGSIIDSLLSMSNNRIINLANPINTRDAATKVYVDDLVSGGLSFKGSFRADTGEILSGANAGSYLYNCTGVGISVSVLIGDYYIVANAGGQFYCSGDILNVGDSVIAVADAAANTSTVDDWATLESDNIEGSGLANTVPLWTDSQVLGDSNISQGAQGDVVINTNTTINDELTMGNTLLMGGNIIDMSGGTIQAVNNPTNSQDAATKAYVDAVDLDFTGNSGTGNVQQGSTFDVLGSGPITTSASGTTLTINSSAAEGTGTTQTLPVWSDGPNGVLSDSGLSQVLNLDATVNTLQISTSQNGNANNYIFGPLAFSSTDFDFKSNGNNGGYYKSGNFRFESNLAVGRTNDPTNASLDVGTSSQGIPAAFFRNGVVISNNPSGVQVDNTSMVIGAGNNDNVSGSDHCLIVGSNNQITSNSDQSVAFGQGNAITSSTDALAVGNSNSLTSSLRTQVLGFSNTVEADSSFIAGGSNQIASTAQNLFVLGYDNQISSNSHQSSYIIGGRNQPLGSNVLEDSFGFGNFLSMRPSTMTLGYRNSSAGVPTPDKNLGLGETKFILGVGSFDTSNTNALIITEGGINGGSGGSTPQIPRVILPTVPTFSASNDAAADAIGVPEGALYQNNGVVQVNRGGGSTTDPLAGGGGAWTTLEVNLSGNVLANTFNGNLSDAITLVTVPANQFAKILEVTGVIYGATSGTTDYNSNNNLYVKRVGSITGSGFSAPEILGSFINSSTDSLTNANGQPVASQANALSSYGGLGADIVLGPSTTGPVTITQGDRTIKLSVTYRLIDFTP